MTDAGTQWIRRGVRTCVTLGLFSLAMPGMAGDLSELIDKRGFTQCKTLTNAFATMVQNGAQHADGVNVSAKDPNGSPLGGYMVVRRPGKPNVHVNFEVNALPGGICTMRYTESYVAPQTCAVVQAAKPELTPVDEFPGSTQVADGKSRDTWFFTPVLEGRACLVSMTW
ncbi:hypothetical protein [Lysobacter soyae]|uniref:Uncharacterized protein n=1 Tax=Lysobacter soyae TaxID=2764185 RepID=A0ABX8WL97_9GAMM|nr:hypothetical protein [Lysobacter sp. CJ11]QYR52395.1 hypothetical protein H8L67_07255 [Lysobacter sp. CJ11]